MNKNSILFIDDEKKILSALERELLNEDYTVFCAESGEKALQVLEKHFCKIIVADVKMPRMNGFELLEKVKKLYPEMIQIVLSGHTDLNLILREVNRKGIDRYITKPWDSNELKMVLKQAVELFDLRHKIAILEGKEDAQNKEQGTT